MSAWMYVLGLRSGAIYAGAARNLLSRLDAHCRGTACRTTAFDPPVGLLYSEDFVTLQQARKRESQTLVPRQEGSPDPRRQRCSEGPLEMPTSVTSCCECLQNSLGEFDSCLPRHFSVRLAEQKPLVRAGGFSFSDRDCTLDVPFPRLLSSLHLSLGFHRLSERAESRVFPGRVVLLPLWLPRFSCSSSFRSSVWSTREPPYSILDVNPLRSESGLRRRDGAHPCLLRSDHISVLAYRPNLSQVVLRW